MVRLVCFLFSSLAWTSWTSYARRATGLLSPKADLPAKADLSAPLLSSTGCEDACGAHSCEVSTADTSGSGRHVAELEPLLPAPVPPTVVKFSVSPSAALLACLQTDLNDAARKTVSSLLFEGLTPTTQSDFYVYLRQGAEIIADHLAHHDPRFYSKGSTGEQPVMVPQVEISTTPSFVLEDDGVRRFFEADYAWHFLKKVFQGPTADADFVAKLDLFERAMSDALNTRAEEAKYLGWNKLDFEAWKREFESGADEENERGNAVALIEDKFAAGDPTRDRMKQFMRIFFMTRALHIAGKLPLNSV